MYICYEHSMYVSHNRIWLWYKLRTIQLSARAGAHIECSSRLCAEDVTITNVIIKPPGWKWDWRCEWRHARKRGTANLGNFWKKQLVEIRTWARSVQFVGYGMRARLLGQWVEILTLGREFRWGVDWRTM